MRILKIRFKNLNSLVGEWEIDLTHPAFASDGIFAITGPTGAGKSTILDAICLALYGRTPRLSRIGKSGNEIMSRQTGECFSEVEFETQAGHFRCHWSQHRSRKKPDGDLQIPKHEITDVDSGKVIEAKLRAVAEKIEQATGMDFDRFTRSMLLAQGDFAAFLQAAPDDRAPILEQITGTEIYSRISIRVHEKRSDERKKLDALQSELAGMQLLSEEDEQQLRISQEQKIAQEIDLSKQVDQKIQAIRWLDGISQLEKDLSLLEEQKQDLFIRQNRFKPERDKLDRAKQALELEGGYAVLTSLRCEQDVDRKELNAYQHILPEQEMKVLTAESTLKLATEDLVQKKQQQKETLFIIKQVREFDFKLREKDSAIKNIENVVSEINKSLNAVRTKHTQDCRDLDTKKIDIGKINTDIDNSLADEGLIEHLAGIRNRFDVLYDLDKKNKDKQEELDTAELKKIAAHRLCNNQSTKLNTQKESLEVMQSAYDEQRNKLKTVLGDREVTAWRNDFIALRDRAVLLEKMSEAVQSLADFRKTSTELNDRHSTLVSETSSLDLKISEQNEKCAVGEREMQLLETQLTLLKKIQHYEEARHQLQDGEPCPLCGAEDHPFAKGNIPIPDEATTALNRVRAELKQANESLSALKISQAKTSKDLEQVAIRQSEIINKITIEEHKIKDGLLVLSAAGIDDEMGEASGGILLRLEQLNKDKLEYTSKVVLAIDEYEKKLISLRQSLEEIKNTVTQLERDTQIAEHKKEAADQTVDRLKEDLKIIYKQIQAAEQDALRDIAPYGIKSLAVDMLNNILSQLTSRRERRLSLKDQLTHLEKTISTLEIQTLHQTDQMIKLETERNKQEVNLNGLQNEQKSLAQERYTLFADKKPDDEEIKISTLIEEAEKYLEHSKQIFNTLAQELANTKSNSEAKEKALLARAEKLKTMEDAFKTRLAAFNFSDEDTYLTSRLSEDERKTLMQKEQLLLAEQTTLYARLDDRSTLLESERKKEMTEQSRDLLNQMLESLKASLKELRLEIGGIQQKLTDNESLRSKQQQRAQAIDAQKKECSRWDVLHELVGSADGKKYRNFAQGLTFEMMIGHANRQLQKMTDRYLLIRDDTQPLELNVVDNYQAGEIRSTKNLSGGEGFIVSLSLALGLSHMASKNVRVDSLFLDEGFGTLDEEALDTALETLAGLQQDGKLIGLISHVPTLKERISTQIQINPHAGGRSVISGPGCSRL